MPSDQRDSRNAGKAPDQLIDLLDAVRRALVHREQHSIHHPLSYGTHRFGNRILMEHREAADARRIQAGTLTRRNNRCDCRGRGSGTRKAVQHAHQSVPPLSTQAQADSAHFLLKDQSINALQVVAAFVK